MKSTIHGVRSFDRSPTTLFKTFLVGWRDFIQQNCFNLTEKRSKVPLPCHKAGHVLGAG